MYRGPLHGIPVALKDLFDTAGIRMTANSRLLFDRIPAQDSTIVARLHASGAVLLGKLKLYEFAMGVPYPGDPIPPARNPWNLERIPGGSSSGSGAALAAGLCAGSFGSDTGGSIRHPAHMSGVVGLKPTYGLVSRHGMIPLSWTLDHAGPMARTVQDVALLLQAVAGYDPADPASVRVKIPDYATAFPGIGRGVRIGVPEAYIESTPGLHADILRAFNEALDVLRTLGATVRPVPLPSAELVDAVFHPILLSEAIAYHSAWLATRREDYGPGFWNRLVPGIIFTGAEYVQAQRGRALFCRAIEELMATVDLIAMPTVRETAPTLAEHMGVAHPTRGPFTGLFNLTGQPSISVPCGFDRQGLPIGLMLSGRAFDEVTVLSVADAYQQATDWHRQHPPLVG
ncbi:MAG TPA: Asp-tRNA(Asn)/Glu-tRNA(Gln) amidotransferase GatCAB subunit A [Chloroflexi bacterium]|nr:Asp-tRNA(Asn)/Glu-tRNA(Gln) amidotransferase GatCAB subunit A [Chloroflexota bacterium]